MITLVLPISVLRVTGPFCEWRRQSLHCIDEERRRVPIGKSRRKVLRGYVDRDTQLTCGIERRHGQRAASSFEAVNRDPLALGSQRGDSSCGIREHQIEVRVRPVAVDQPELDMLAIGLVRPDAAQRHDRRERVRERLVQALAAN